MLLAERTAPQSALPARRGRPGLLGIAKLMAPKRSMPAALQWPLSLDAMARIQAERKRRALLASTALLLAAEAGESRTQEGSEATSSTGERSTKPRLGQRSDQPDVRYTRRGDNDEALASAKTAASRQEALNELFLNMHSKRVTVPKRGRLEDVCRLQQRVVC